MINIIAAVITVLGRLYLELLQGVRRALYFGVE